MTRHRRLFSFMNGILLLGHELPGYVGPPLRPDGHGRFFFYNPSTIHRDDAASAFGSELVPLAVHSSRFFKCNFPEDVALLLNSGGALRESILSWSQIDGKAWPTAWPTPLFDMLFNRQGYEFFREPFDPDRPTNPFEDDVLVCSSLFQIYAMFGRLLYRVNELDNYQVCVFLLGVAGTGKSVICEIISKFYGKEAIGRMSANCQQTFALSAHVDKHLIVCPEVKSNFGLAASDFQSMVTGESVTANRKHQEVVMIRKWPSQMLLAGNDVPPWSDSLGALFRRLFVIRLTNAVRDDQVDTTIAKRLREELPFLLLKFHACYMQLLQEYGSASFWSFADQKFIKSREHLELELCPTKKFLSNSDELNRDDVLARSNANYTMYIPYDRLNTLCNDWCKKQGISTMLMSSSNREDHNRKILSDLNYCVSTRLLPNAPGCPDRQIEYVLGITEHSLPLVLPAHWRTTEINK